jgi:hypothetical protein
MTLPASDTACLTKSAVDEGGWYRLEAQLWLAMAKAKAR